MRFPSIKSWPLPVRWIPLLKPVMSRPLTVLPPPAIARPSAAVGTWEPSIWISKMALSPWARVFGCDPGWLYPLMIAAWVSVGSGVRGLIKNGPVPGILKSIVSTPVPVSELTWPMAHRSEPVLVSSRVSVTVKVESIIRGSSSCTAQILRLAVRGVDPLASFRAANPKTRWTRNEAEVPVPSYRLSFNW